VEQPELLQDCYVERQEVFKRPSEVSER